jgi:hypothetical protein
MAEMQGTVMYRRGPLHKIAWEEINEPGAYVEVSTGKLYRVPRECLPVGKSRLRPGHDGPSSPLVRLSKDPFIFALAARMLCVEYHIWPDF